MNQTAHDCPDCTEELLASDDGDVVLKCEGCGAMFRGTETDEGDLVITTRYAEP